MKKRLFAIIITIGLIIAVALGIIWKLRRIEIINLIPREAVLYLETTELARTYGSLKESSFWKEARDLEIWEKMKSSPRWKRFEESRKELESRTGLKLDENNLKELAGKQVGFALFESASGAPAMLLLSEVGIKREIMITLDRFRKGGEKYKGLKVDVIETPRLKLYYLFIKNIAVLATNTSLLEKVVDIYRGKKTGSLVEEEKFKEVRSRLSLEGKGLVYFDREKFIRILLPLVQGNKIRAKRVLSSRKSIAAGAGKLLLTPQGARIESYLLFKKDGLSEELRRMYRMKPRRRFKSLEFIPEDSLLYGVESALDVKVLYDSLLQNWEKEEKAYANIKKGLGGFEERFGIKIEKDLLPCLNGEIAYTIPEIDLKGPFPSPKIAFLLGIGEKERWSKILKRFEQVIAEEGKLKIEKKEYEGIEMSFIRLPLASEGLRPAYALVNDFFILNTSTSSLEQMIKVYQSKTNPLAESESFEVVKSSSLKGAKGLYYVDLERSLDIALESLQSFSPLLFKKKEEKERFEKVIYPVLKLLRVLKGLGISITRDEEGIKEVFVCSIEDLPPQIPEK